MSQVKGIPYGISDFNQMRNGNFYFGEGENKKYMLRRNIGMIAGGTGITPVY